MSEQIDFHQLIDLSFGSGTKGLLNTRYLQALLHAIVHKLELNTCKIELNGGLFSNCDCLVEKLDTEIQVAEYEALKNCSTGKYDKKKQLKKCDNQYIDTVMVLRDIKPRCGTPNSQLTTALVIVDENLTFKRNDMKNDLKKVDCKPSIMKDSTPKRLDAIEKCMENVLQNLNLSDSCNQPSSCCEEMSSSNARSRPCSSQSTNTTSSGCNNPPPEPTPPCTCSTPKIASDVDTRLVACIQQITQEMDQIKHEVCTTQKCLNNVCEKTKALALASDETDIKFDEVMKLFDDYDKRLGRNCADICACHKQIEDNIQRIDGMYEEIETLFRIKADRDEVEDCLKQKANRCELELKVDLEVFNNVKSELSEAILDSHYRIKSLSNELEARVKQICQCLNTKVDRDAFCQFANCIECRIKQIATETRKWQNIRKMEVCPFTRKPFVQNLQCGACNQAVVMRGIEGNVPLMPSLSQITWNCHTKSLKCQRAGGRHTITTPHERCPKQSKFYEHFGGRLFANPADCEPEHDPLKFTQSCYDAICEEERPESSNPECTDEITTTSPDCE